MTEAAALDEAVLARHPADPQRQRNVALMDKYLAGSLLQQGDLKGAFPYLKRAADLDESRTVHAPRDPVAKLDFAIDLSQWGTYYSMKKDIPSAIEFTRRSLALRREIAAANPKDAWAQDRLVFILGRLGDLQLERSPREAISAYREALSVAGKPEERAQAMAGMAEAYGKLGNQAASCAAYANAAKLYREIAKGPQKARYAPNAADTEKAYAMCSGR